MSEIRNGLDTVSAASIYNFRWEGSTFLSSFAGSLVAAPQTSQLAPAQQALLLLCASVTPAVLENNCP